MPESSLTGADAAASQPYSLALDGQRRRAQAAEDEARRLEAERFKREIDLPGFMFRAGFRPRGWKASVPPPELSPGRWMKFGEPKEQAIIVHRRADGRYVWFDGYDPGRRGDVMDFLREYMGFTNLGDIRKELRRELGTSNPRASSAPPTNPEANEAVERRRLAEETELRARRVEINRQYRQADSGNKSGYLAMRGLLPSTLESARFRDTFRTRRAGREVLFPHLDDRSSEGEGICGFERKSADGTKFSRGGRKGLCCSRSFPGDSTLVVTEGFLDGMSYEQLFDLRNARYLATSGTAKESQLELIVRAIRRMPANGLVIAATDNDFSHLAHFMERVGTFRQFAHARADASSEVQVFARPDGTQPVAIRTPPGGDGFECKSLSPAEFGAINAGLNRAQILDFTNLTGAIRSLPEHVAACGLEVPRHLSIPTNPGRVMAAKIRELAESAGLRVETPLPALGCKDWNDVLRERQCESERGHSEASRGRQDERSR